jgi:predicted phage terminase large subunit-like protein
VLKDGSSWELLRLAAIAETDESFEIEDASGRRHVARTAGEALHPAREDIALLESIRRRDEHDFAALYQQKPRPTEGACIKRDWFRFCEPREFPQKFDRVIQSWDTGNLTTEESAYSVCTTWGVKQLDFFLLDVFRQKLAYPDLKRAVKDQRARHTPALILIERGASGLPLIQELEREKLPVKGIDPEGSKRDRLRAQVPAFSSGRVHLPAQAAWLTAYVEELTAFPNSDYKDQVDSTSQALAWLNSEPPEPNALRAIRIQRTMQMIRAGTPLAVAAASTSVTPEEVQYALDAPKRAAEAIEDAFKRHNRKACWRCAKPIEGTYVEAGVDIYFHPDCHRLSEAGR